MLADPDYALDGGGYAQFDSFNAAEQVGLELATAGSRCERALVNDAAGRRHVAHVVVPIWRDDYDALSRAKFDCLRLI